MNLGLLDFKIKEILTLESLRGFWWANPARRLGLKLFYNNFCRSFGGEGRLHFKKGSLFFLFFKIKNNKLCAPQRQSIEDSWLSNWKQLGYASIKFLLVPALSRGWIRCPLGAPPTRHYGSTSIVNTLPEWRENYIFKRVLMKHLPVCN